MKRGRTWMRCAACGQPVPTCRKRGCTAACDQPATTLAQLNSYLVHQLVRNPAGYYYWPAAIGLPHESDSVQYVFNHRQLTIREWQRREDAAFRREVEGGAA